MNGRTGLQSKVAITKSCFQKLLELRSFDVAYAVVLCYKLNRRPLPPLEKLQALISRVVNEVFGEAHFAKSA